MTGITLVTYADHPFGSEDDRSLAEAFEREGVTARFAVWDDDLVNWSETGLAIVRSPGIMPARGD